MNRSRSAFGSRNSFMNFVQHHDQTSDFNPNIYQKSNHKLEVHMCKTLMSNALQAGFLICYSILINIEKKLTTCHCRSISPKPTGIKKENDIPRLPEN